MHGDADGRGAARRHHPAGDELEAAVPAHLQDRDLAAAGINGEQVAAVAAELERSLGSQAGTRPGAPGRERRPRHGREGPVGVAVKRPDRVGAQRVVVEVDMSYHWREGVWRAPEDAVCTSRAGDEGAKGTGTGERGDAERKARGAEWCTSACVRDLPGSFGGTNCPTPT